MSLKRTSPPFRADHVGSLLRPPALKEAREAHQAGRISAAQLQEAADTAVREVVKLQEDVGLKGITDGEVRRSSWHMDFLYQIGGVTKYQDNLKVKFNNPQGGIEFTPSALRITGKLKLTQTIFGEAFSYLKSVTTKGTPKLTIPAPSMIHYRGGSAAIDTDVYPQIGEFWSDLKSVYADEVEALGKLGCKYLQLDDTSLAYLNDPTQRAYMEKQGGDAKNQHLVERRACEKACGHGGVHAPLSRQLPLVVGGVGRLRLRGRGVVQRAEGGWVLPGVRR
jgi:5-methyltetrahydropteroyltriglutamate--homocysteine methyltransferase